MASRSGHSTRNPLERDVKRCKRKMDDLTDIKTELMIYFDELLHVAQTSCEDVAAAVAQKQDDSFELHRARLKFVNEKLEFMYNKLDGLEINTDDEVAALSGSIVVHSRSLSGNSTHRLLSDLDDSTVASQTGTLTPPQSESVLQSATCKERSKSPASTVTESSRVRKQTSQWVDQAAMHQQNVQGSEDSGVQLGGALTSLGGDEFVGVTGLPKPAEVSSSNSQIVKLPSIHQVPPPSSTPLPQQSESNDVANLPSEGDQRQLTAAAPAKESSPASVVVPHSGSGDNITLDPSAVASQAHVPAPSQSFQCPLGVPELLGKIEDGEIKQKDHTKNETLKVNLSWLNDPSSFWVQLQNQRADAISKELLEYYDSKTADVWTFSSEELAALKVHQYIGAPYLADIILFYRAYIYRLEGEWAQVLYIDYGNIDWLRIDCLRKMKPALFYVVWQAFHCRLHQLVPRDHVEWSAEEVNVCHQLFEKYSDTDQYEISINPLCLTKGGMHLVMVKVTPIFAGDTELDEEKDDIKPGSLDLRGWNLGDALEKQGCGEMYPYDPQVVTPYFNSSVAFMQIRSGPPNEIPHWQCPAMLSNICTDQVQQHQAAINGPSADRVPQFVASFSQATAIAPFQMEDAIDNNIVHLRIISIVDPGEFFARLDKNHEELLQRLDDSLGNDYGDISSAELSLAKYQEHLFDVFVTKQTRHPNSGAQKPLPDIVKHSLKPQAVGLLLVVELQNHQTTFRRAVLRGYDDASKQTEVLLIDAGDIVNVPVQNCFLMEQKFADQPQQSIRCYLSDLAPLTHNGAWLAGCIEESKRLMNPEVMHSAFVLEKGTDFVGIEVMLDNNKTVNQTLVASNLARSLTGRYADSLHNGAYSNFSSDAHAPYGVPNNDYFVGGEPVNRFGRLAANPRPISGYDHHSVQAPQIVAGAPAAAITTQQVSSNNSFNASAPPFYPSITSQGHPAAPTRPADAFPGLQSSTGSALSGNPRFAVKLNPSNSQHNNGDSFVTASSSSLQQPVYNNNAPQSFSGIATSLITPTKPATTTTSSVRIRRLDPPSINQFLALKVIPRFDGMNSVCRFHVVLPFGTNPATSGKCEKWLEKEVRLTLKKITKHFDANQVVHLDKVEIGDHIVVRIPVTANNKPGFIYRRAEVLSIEAGTVPVEMKVTVFVVDGGDEHTVPLTDTFKLQPEFAHAPQFAYQIELSDIEPKPNTTNPGLEALVRDKLLIARVAKDCIPSTNGSWCAVVDLYDTSGAKDIRINDSLVDSLKIAIKKPKMS